MYNYTNIALTLFATVFSLTATFSQDNQSGTEISEIRKNKNHLDLDIKNIFNRLEGASLIYKRSYQSGDLIDVSSIKLIRFWGSINNQITFEKDPVRDPNDPRYVSSHPSNVINFTLGTGIERQRMNKNFVHYYGIDAVFNYFDFDTEIFYSASSNGITYAYYPSSSTTINGYRTGVNPFLGFKYYFTDRLSIGVETGISLLYFSQTAREFWVQAIIANGQVTKITTIQSEPIKSSGILTSFNNLRFLTVGYTF